MRIDPSYINQLHFLAEQLQQNDRFEDNVKKFNQIVARLKAALYRHVDDTSVLYELDQLPDIELQPYRRSFLEQMLPGSARDMVGKSKSRDIIRQQVDQTLQSFERIQSWLQGDEFV